MKTSGTFRRYLGLWTSGLAAGALAACASPTAPTPSSAGAPVAVPLKSSADRGAPARLWRGGGIAAAPAATPAASAVTLIGRLAPAWGAPAGTADLIPLATVAVDGGDVVRVRQQIDGIAVDGGELRVLVGRGGTLIAAAGALVPADIARDRSSYRLDAAAAVARAIGDLHGVDIADTALRGHHKAGAATGGDDVAWFAGEVAGVHVEEARARKLWHRDGDALVAAWVVEAFTSSVDTTDALAYRTVVGARDGRVLARRDLTHDAFQYRVFAENGGDKRPLDGPVADFSPHPTGEPGGARPSFIPPNLVSVDGLNHPADGAAADPWLAADATETVGNNVDAYTDINSPSGLSQGDFRAEVTGAGVFDRTYDPTVGPLTSGEQQRAAITQLFYSINWLHDDWYDAGFTEAAGNGQQDNYGRGGVAGDRIRAEAQDGANNGNRNNANMSTPDDGMSPRMQVYLWSGLEDRLLTVQSSNRTPASRGAAFGPQSYDVQGDLVAAVDGGGTSPSDGCEPLTNAAAVAGKIALVDRGVCTFKTKTLNAQNAGAIGVILANNAASTSPPSMPNDAMITTPITIPTMSVLQSEGATLRTELMAGPVQMAMHRAVGPEADGALDGALVAHEFGHYVHHRLSLCGTAQCGAMSEGWGDFIALHMIARPGDDLTGTYSVSGYAYAGDPYFGIRRAPYSITTSKNAFTFRHVADGQALPSTHPISGGGPNSEVHNAGEVWAEAMWEAYVALQQARGAASFDEVRRKMQRYVVAGLLMSPPDATFTEVRDAILAAAQASSPADHGTLANAFARRGLGSCAVSPARDSDDFVGVVESFDVKGHASAGAPQLAVDVKDCDDDDNLDVGETATLTVPVVNTGAAALSDVVVSVATTTPGVTIVTPSVTVGSLAPYASGMATFQVRLDAATGLVAATLDVTVASPGGCTETQQIPLPVRLEADDHEGRSASDTFDAAASPWTPSGDNAAVAWKHVATTALDRHWHGTGLGTDTDVSLVSPPMTASSDAVRISFDHSYQFEFSQDTYFDGGVIEITTDAGATWVDVATLTSVPYVGVLGDQSGNPLGGRMAFADTNPSFPGTDRVTLDFGTQLAGKTFQLRFRIGTDAGVGSPGWDLDDLEATGLANTPFPVQAADGATCDGGPGPDEEGGGDDGGCCSTGAPRGSDLAAGLLVLGLVARRRRRRA
ncbi:MAG TPA: M36 family metallopeptidase [Kofleriaceae bacterium]|nr:M36 family metallopeptidase [Kofleriaceae bacterium]